MWGGMGNNLTVPEGGEKSEKNGAQNRINQEVVGEGRVAYC